MRPHVQHKKLKLSVGDIYLDSRKAKIEPTKPSPAKRHHRPQVSDPFLSYK